MDTQIKNILGMVVIGALVIAAGSAMILTRAFSKSVDPAATRSFVVSAEGRAFAAPDIAEFSFSVISQGTGDLAALQKQNTEKMNKVITYIKSQGVQEKDIQTSGYNVNPQYVYSQCRADGICPPPRIVGYEVNQTVTVKARDFDKVGPMLSGVVSNGANSVSSLVFRQEDATAAQNEARTEAIEKAKSQAKDVAKAGGFRLGKLLSIEENTGGYPVPYAYGRGGASNAVMMEAKDMAQSAPSVEAGTNEIVMQVVLRYEIK